MKHEGNEDTYTICAECQESWDASIIHYNHHMHVVTRGRIQSECYNLMDRYAVRVTVLFREPEWHYSTVASYYGR